MPPLIQRKKPILQMVREDVSEHIVLLFPSDTIASRESDTVGRGQEVRRFWSLSHDTVIMKGVHSPLPEGESFSLKLGERKKGTTDISLREKSLTLSQA